MNTDIYSCKDKGKFSPVRPCPSISGLLQLQQLQQDEQARCLSAACGANGKSQEVDEQQRSEEKPGAHAKSGTELKLSSIPIENPSCIPQCSGVHRTERQLNLFPLLQEQAGVDIYEKKNQPSNATGGVQLGPESAAFAAVQRAAALAGPSMIHCDLCNVRPPSAKVSSVQYSSMPEQKKCLCRMTEARGKAAHCSSLRTCNVLQANFAGDAQYKQHVEGPIHRKALAKAEAQRQRDLQLGASKGAAESALVRTFAFAGQWDMPIAA